MSDRSSRQHRLCSTGAWVRVNDFRMDRWSDRYPSAVAALRSRSVEVPILTIGSELGVDCAPIEANFRNFFDAASSIAVEVTIENSGHFQFLDQQSTLQRAVCLQGTSVRF